MTIPQLPQPQLLNKQSQGPAPRQALRPQLLIRHLMLLRPMDSVEAQIIVGRLLALMVTRAHTVEIIIPSADRRAQAAPRAR